MDFSAVLLIILSLTMFMMSLLPVRTEYSPRAAPSLIVRSASALSP
jgi:hypothetical protein